MKDLFDRLRGVLAEHEAKLEGMPDDDAIFALGELDMELTEVIGQFSMDATEKLTEGGELSDVQLREPAQAVADPAKLAEASVLALGMAGILNEKVLGAAAKAGRTDLVTEVAKVLPQLDTDAAREALADVQ